MKRDGPRGYKGRDGERTFVEDIDVRFKHFKCDSELFLGDSFHLGIFCPDRFASDKISNLPIFIYMEEESGTFRLEDSYIFFPNEGGFRHRYSVWDMQDEKYTAENAVDCQLGRLKDKGDAITRLLDLENFPYALISHKVFAALKDNNLDYLEGLET